MTWKTTWDGTSNYAASGTADLERLISNITELVDALRSEFGFNITPETFDLDGYDTYALIPLLNQIETAVNGLKQFDIEFPVDKVWTHGDVPTFDDPNRWEHTGQMVEENIERGRRNFSLCGTFSAGGVI